MVLLEISTSSKRLEVGLLYYDYDRNFTIIRTTITTESISMKPPACGKPGTID
jgi:hypothetical protein